MSKKNLLDSSVYFAIYRYIFLLGSDWLRGKTEQVEELSLNVHNLKFATPNLLQIIFVKNGTEYPIDNN